MVTESGIHHRLESCELQAEGMQHFLCFLKMRKILAADRQSASICSSQKCIRLWSLTVLDSSKRFDFNYLALSSRNIPGGNT